MPRCLDDPGLPRPPRPTRQPRLRSAPGCLLRNDSRPPVPLVPRPGDARATSGSTFANQQSARNRISSEPAGRRTSLFLPRNLPIQQLPKNAANVLEDSVLRRRCPRRRGPMPHHLQKPVDIDASSSNLLSCANRLSEALRGARILCRVRGSRRIQGKPEEEWPIKGQDR